MESDFIRWLRQRTSTHPRLELGIGDDAALLRWPSDQRCVITTDAITDGVDFRLAEADPQKIGRKALAVNLSDLAAMGARPIAAVIALVLPHNGADALARALFEGLLPLAEKYSVAIAGGDTNTWSGQLVITVTVIGEVPAGKAWRRSGARPGDQILVTGSFGGSILGRHFDFEPRVAEALLLREHYEIHAATDVSDGLSLDLSHIAQESECGAVLDLDQIPVAAAAQVLSTTTKNSLSPLQHALADGEDFELVLAVAPDEAERLLREQPLTIPLTRIGTFVEEPGLWSRDENGNHQALRPQGFEHASKQ